MVPQQNLITSPEIAGSFRAPKGCRRNFPAMRDFRLLVLVFLLHSAALVAAQGSSNKSSTWQTLSGNAPLVIARGGFSGLFPDSSFAAYSFALSTSLSTAVLWCDVQLTKDGAGICFPSLTLDNSTDIANVFNNRNKAYLVNGVSTQGWFSVDFTLNELANVYLTQGIYSRTNKFDGNLFQILTALDVARQFRPPGFWLNVQHEVFFTQHNLSMRSLVLNVSRSVIVNYISSPEVYFLSSIYARFKPSKTKLVFRFMDQGETEPSTNKTYGSLLNNLTFIKTFASGILVPKTYIWPVDPSQYLQPHTSIVSDAHKEGLEVFASDFMNDVPLSYNYSYDPVAESVSFIDNGVFSVDGLLSDFPITQSEAIGCFSHIGKNDLGQAKPLVISYNGASGDYPGCTDLAYINAISDGADVLDCRVQMSKDGIPFCLSSINLIDSTTAAQSPFSNLSMSIPEIKSGNGIFTFSLKWSEIQSLTPVISNPYSDFRMYRNPKFKNAGRFLTLTDFLALTRNATSLSGVLIIIENAAYLAENVGLSVTDAVLDALSESGYNNQTAKEVMIQSSNSSVLMKFKEKNNYKLVYRIIEIISDASNSTIEDIANFAHAVVVGKSSVFPDTQAFLLTKYTDVVAKLHSFKLPVYAQIFRNEFTSQAWDFFSDATVEINSYVIEGNIDGIITDFPQTAAKYKKNLCLGLGDKTPNYMLPVQPGGLLQIITTPYLPPAEAPLPILTENDVNEPPLPSVVPMKAPPSDSGKGSAAPAPISSNGQPKIAACTLLSILAILATSLLL